MRYTNSQKFRLGLFVVSGTILFSVAVYLIGQHENMFKKTFTISAFFQNVNGLQKGNNVRFSGINIGTVKSIEMLNDSAVEVVMNIEKVIITHIKKNAIATIGSDGLVGNMIVNIIPGKGSSVEINNGETIASNSKIGADDILSTLSVTNENAAILTSDLLKITTEILKGKGIIGVLLNDTLMAKDLKQSVGNFKRASKRAIASIDALNEILQEIKTNNQSTLGVLLHDSISGGKIKNTLKNLEVSSVEVQKTINMANVFMNDFKTSEGAFNYVVRDTALVHRLETILNNVNEGTVKFSENMEALKYNFLTRGYFRRLERQQRKAKEAQ